jgi:heme-degrading monooxygenase HmoA
MAIIELARYRLQAGADEKVLAAAEEEIQRTVGPSHPGFVSRELLKSSDGSLVLIMRWENAEAAETWNNTLFASAAGRQLGPLVDPASMSMERLTSFKP